MKKYILGLMSGIMLSVCSAAIASDAVQALLFPDRIVVNGEVKQLSIVDERLSNRQDMLAMSKVLMESAKQGDLEKAEEIMDAYSKQDREQLFLSLTKYLHLYAEEPHMSELLQLFIAKGVNLEVRDESSGNTPLLVLASQTPQYINLLIDAGADVNTGDKDGRTPLMEIAKRGMPALVQNLLIHGANPNARASNGYTPLKAAVFPMFTNYRQETVDTTALLLAAKANVNALDEDGNSPLLVTSAYAAISKPVMLLLLDGGADVEAKDNKQRTALHNSVQGGDPDLISKLIKRGVPVDSKDAEGNTPLYYAVNHMNHTGNDSMEAVLQIIRLLIRAGANPNESNIWGVSPVNQAAALDDTGKQAMVLKALQEQQ